MWQVAPLASVSSRDLDNFLLMWVTTNLVLLFLSFFLLKKILDKKSNVKMGIKSKRILKEISVK